MNFSILLLAFIITICEWESLDYFHMKRHCKKNKGICKNCVCFSCPRKKYIDEYKLSKNNN